MSDEREAMNDRIREIFIANGFTIKEGQTDLKPYVYEAAYALLRATQFHAGANETTLRVLSSHAIRKHEGVTIFGDPAQVLKVMAAMESAGATDQEPVGIIERDEINGWHMNALIDWEKIGLGTKLYAAPIGDNGASGYIQYSDELMPRTPGEKAAFLEGIEEGRMRAVRDAQPAKSGTEAVFAQARKAVEKDMAGFRERLLEMAQPAESKRVELTPTDIRAIANSYDLDNAPLIVEFSRTLLARSSAKDSK